MRLCFLSRSESIHERKWLRTAQTCSTARACMMPRQNTSTTHHHRCLNGHFSADHGWLGSHWSCHSSGWQPLGMRHFVGLIPSIHQTKEVKYTASSILHPLLNDCGKQSCSFSSTLWHKYILIIYHLIQHILVWQPSLISCWWFLIKYSTCCYFHQQRNIFLKFKNLSQTRK